MLIDAQQVFDTRSAWNRTVLLTIAGILCTLSACQGTPTRADRWRDEPIEAVSLGGDSLAEQPTETGLAGGAAADRNDTLRIHLNADPGSLNPMAAPSVWALRIMMDTVFETLLRYQPSPGVGPGLYEAGLARSWTISPDGREIRLQLQPAAKFHDGKSLTALDVQFSIEAAMTKRGGAPHHRQVLADVAAVEIVGRDQVRIRLHRSNSFVLRELASLPIFPEHVYLKKIKQRSGSWIGSGPYRVSTDESGDVFLSRDSEYWGKAPAIRRIHFVRQKDSALALRAAKEGQMDIVPELIAEHYPGQAKSPGIAGKFSGLELRPANFSYMVFNTTAPPFDDVHVRRALSHLVDGDALVAASGGLTRRVAGPVWPGGPGDGAAPAASPQDLAEVSRLLQLAGWRDDDGDGVRARGGQRLLITVLATEGAHQQRDPILKSLRKAGFVLDIRVGSAAVLLNRLRDGEFNLAFVAWSGHFDRDLSSLFSRGGKLNHGRFESASIDELLGRIKAAWEPTLRAPLLGTLAESLRRSMPIVALLAPHPRGLVHKRVIGLKAWDNWFSLRDLSLAKETGE
jgi:peptide/nickel transport system substrate-binding protein